MYYDRYANFLEVLVPIYHVIPCWLDVKDSVRRGGIGRRANRDYCRTRMTLIAEDEYIYPSYTIFHLNQWANYVLY